MSNDNQSDLEPETKTWLASESPNPIEPNPVSGKYKILHQIAEHGQGIVLLAFDPDLCRQVVIKISRFPLELDGQATIAEEARALARLDHPHLAKVYELGFNEVQCPFIVMEHIEGRNLAELLKDRRYTPVEACALIRKLADGIEHAHQAGVIHCDLKPSNVVIRNDGVPKIIDFGLARLHKPLALWIQN